MHQFPRVFLAAALFAAPVMASAQTPDKTDLVLVPRKVADAALNWIGEPNPTIAVKLYAALSACIQDNPHEGTVMRIGADQCPEVTAGIAARVKELADAKATTSQEPHP